MIGLAQGQARAQGQTAPEVTVLSTSPTLTDCDLQIICLFRVSPRNTFNGALTLTDNATNGLLAKVCGKDKFEGYLGETMLLTPPPGEIKAKHLMLIGLGDSQTFTPAEMHLIGEIVVRASDRLRIKHPYFAPCIKDGGVDRYTTGEIAKPVVRGIIAAYRTALYIKTLGADGGPSVEQVTYLAGKQYAATTQQGIDQAYAAYAIAPPK